VDLELREVERQWHQDSSDLDTFARLAVLYSRVGKRVCLPTLELKYLRTIITADLPLKSITFNISSKSDILRKLNISIVGTIGKQETDDSTPPYIFNTFDKGNLCSHQHRTTKLATRCAKRRAHAIIMNALYTKNLAPLLHVFPE